MNWSALKYNWNHLRAFLAVAEEGSISAAARALGISQPTMGRQVAALERELDVTLFDRVGTRLHLSPSGRELLEFARKVGEAASEFALTATGQESAVEGSVRLSVGELFAIYVMPEILSRLRQVAPGIEIELIGSNESSDLKAREADIAFRADHTPRSDIAAVEVLTLASRFYATDDYLDSVGTSSSALDFIGFEDDGAYLHYLQNQGFKVDRRNIRIRADSHAVHWAMAKRGLGIGIAPELVGDGDTAMRRVWPEMRPVISKMSLIAHREVLKNRRVDIIYDALLKELGELGR